MHLLPMYYFKVVVKNKSINKAAQELHITQQTLSAHMNSVEKELGCVLFKRNPHFQLTYEGEKFYQYVKAITGTYESMQKEFQLLAKNESGVLRIGIAHTRSHALIPRAAKKFIPEHPYIRLDLQELSNDGLISGLQEGELDLAIGDIPLDSPDYAAQELFKDEILLVVPENYVMESSAYPYILGKVPLLVNHREDVSGRIASMILKENGIVPKIAASSDNTETLLDMCNMGLGACFCSDRLFRFHHDTDKEGNGQVKVFHTGVTYSIVAAYQKADVMSHLINSFIRALK